MNRLLLIPLAGGAVAAAGMLMADPAAYYRAILVAASFTTALSAFVTMRHFAPGDKLFMGWLLLGGGYGVASIRYMTRLYTLATGVELLGRPAIDSLLILQNALIAISVWLFVRSWHATGLAVPVSRTTQLFWTVGGIAAAILVGGYPLLQGMATAHADSVLLVSTLGDIIGIALIAPLAMSALALRGGLLMHTWMYLAACETFWLAYDVWLAIRQSAGIGPRAGQGVEQIIRMIAILLAFAATIAQRRAIRPARLVRPIAPAPSAI